MLGESQAIQRVPPLGSGTTLVAGTVDSRAQSLTLVATVASASTNILPTAANGYYITFVAIGTAEVRIRFTVGASAPATVTDFPIPPSGKEEWWITNETTFSALSSAAAVLGWYRSSP